ncbi:hypothetical protein DPMN_071175 [Dreissena polymorpha]|uniref:Uncharacterized protein n=1 Tax=Dreissena polymorpha TaxID=45954 RepID=A0A9D3Z681_DREPO|nr:hypothetical protein DPMN_071175 [Dreissena polymorpha]
MGTPIFRKGDLTVPANYCNPDLSLLPNHEKYRQRLGHKHLEHHGILTDSQHRNRERRTSESQYLLTLRVIALDLKDGDQINAVLLDVKSLGQPDHSKEAKKALLIATPLRLYLSHRGSFMALS